MDRKMLKALFRKGINFGNTKIQAKVSKFFFDLDSYMEPLKFRPEELHLSLTNLCNAKCVFCGYQYQKYPKSIMPDDIFIKALEDYLSLGGGNVFLTPPVGEPLLDPKFCQRVEHLRSFKQIGHIKVITNGILIDKHGIDRILTSGLNELHLSTSGFDKASWERIYQIKGAFERMRDNAISLARRNSELDYPVDLRIRVLSDRTIDEVLAAKEFDMMDKYKVKIEYIHRFSNFSGLIKELPKGMIFWGDQKKPEPCIIIYHGPVIMPDGNVIACNCHTAMDPVEDLILGNIKYSSLCEIWRGSRTHALITQFIEKRLNERCQNCTTYRNLDLYRTFQGRERLRRIGDILSKEAELNHADHRYSDKK